MKNPPPAYRFPPLPPPLAGPRERSEPLSRLAAALLLAGAFLLRPFGNLENPANVAPFLGAAAVMSAGFLLALRVRCLTPLWFWLVAVGLRAVLFGMEPGRDIYRYIWEGEVQNAGFSPYCHAPASEVLALLRNPSWLLVQHKDVAAIYPPLAELIFRVVTAISAGVPAMKLVFVAADLTVCRLLFGRHNAALALGYAWNPLVLYSFSGGGHYDSLFLLAVTWGIVLWEERASPARRFGSAVLLGAGVALKWLCLPVLGWVLWRILRMDGPKRFLLAGCASAAPFAVAWVIVAAGQWNCPLLPVDFSRVARSAEAVPALGTWLLPDSHWLNRNSSYFAIFAIVSAFLVTTQTSIQRAAHSILSSALLLTPMFHAWYGTWITPLLASARWRSCIALSISAFVYFRLHYTAGQPGGIWRQSWWEKLLLWGPFLAGLLWDYRIRRPTVPPPPSADHS